MTSVKPYSAYKDSGTKWLGEVPGHWATSRLRQIAVIIMGQAPDGESVNNEGQGIPFLQGCAEFGATFPSAKNYCQQPSKIASADSVLFSVRAPVGRMNRADQIYGIGRGLCAVAPTPKAANTSFVQYALAASMDQFHAVATGSTYDAVSSSDVANALIPLPPLDEQRAIADFLDGMDARITHFIAAQRKMIALLEEQKQAIINQAVTLGLDPDVPLKDSGVDWLGEIPAHWEAAPLKRELWNWNTRRVPLSSTERGVVTERTYDYYGASGVIDKVEDFLFDGSFLLVAEDGANLVLRNLPLAIVAKGKFWVNNHAHILEPIKGSLEYFARLLETIDYRPWISGAAQPKLT